MCQIRTIDYREYFQVSGELRSFQGRVRTSGHAWSPHPSYLGSPSSACPFGLYIYAILFPCSTLLLCWRIQSSCGTEKVQKPSTQRWIIGPQCTADALPLSQAPEPSLLAAPFDHALVTLLLIIRPYFEILKIPRFCRVDKLDSWS